MVGDGSHKTQMDTKRLKVQIYPWGGNYQPRTEAELLWKPEQGFQIKMRSYETEIRAENFGDNSPVYQDSCMEFFVNFFPEQSRNYINFEVNPNGAMLSQFGPDREHRVPIIEKGCKHPKVSVTRETDYWEIAYEIPYELIQKLYEGCSFSEGHKIRCNFYKCGDFTKNPHYGCWTPIQSEMPNFHLPDYFGELII